MRLRLTTGRTALFGALLAAALILFLPMRLMLGALGAGSFGLTARQVSGSVWDARLSDAQLAGVPLDEIEARLSPLALLVGKARLALASRGDVPLAGAITVARHLSALDNMTGHLDGVSLIRVLPPAAVDLDGLSVRFVDGACSEASGRVRVTLSGSVEGITLPTLLAGDARCDGAALLLPLTAQGGGDGVTLRLDGSGSYQARIVLAAPDAQTAARLAASGFVAGANGWQLTAEGRL